MSHSSYKISGLDSKEIYVNRWKPAGESKAVAVIVHGMAEYSMRYESFAAFLNTKDIEVVAHDHRGHGRSLDAGDTIGFIDKIDGWNILMSDLDVLVESIRKQNSSKPMVILGMSMGAIIVLNYLQEYGKKADAYVLSALPYQQDLLSDIGKAVSRLQSAIFGKESPAKIHNALSFGAFNKPFRPNRTAFDWLSRDEAEVDKYVADPLLGNVFTSQFFYDLSTGVRNIYRAENLKKLDSEAQILLLSGDSDPVTGGPEKFEKTYNLLKLYAPNITKKSYVGARHELLNETNKSEVFEDIYLWIKERIYAEESH